MKEDGKLLEGRRVKLLTDAEAMTLSLRGYVAYSEGPPARKHELRAFARVRTRLKSAKLIDGGGAFLCDATVQDTSAGGMRLLLARNIGLPARFGVHDDDSGVIFTASQAWRRDHAVGVRFHHRGPPSPMKRSDRVALRGRYYAVRG